MINFFTEGVAVMAGFGNKLSIDNNVARAVRTDGDYTITLIVERRDGKEITERDASIVLTKNIQLMFHQQTSY